jgi:glycosyltransferase involved in cell wall biosynthesis
VPVDQSLRKGKSFVLGYVGVIGDQDGVDHMVLALDHLVRHGVGDFHAIIVGDGPALASARELAATRGIQDFITFTGYLTGDALLRHLSTFDIGIIPDPVNPYNDKISMNKVFEYSALGIPSVTYPLTETRRLLGDAGVYAEGSEPVDLAAACMRLVSDAALRERCASAASRLSERSFNWDREAAVRSELSRSADTDDLPVVAVHRDVAVAAQVSVENGSRRHVIERTLETQFGGIDVVVARLSLELILFEDRGA